MQATIETVQADAKKISQLFQKAASSSSVREKNYFLQELKQLVKRHQSEYQAAVAEGDRLDQEIAKAQNELRRVQDEYQSLSESVSFLDDIEFYQSAKDVPSLKRQIESLEKDISSIGVLPEKELLGSKLGQAKDIEFIYLDLLDLRETRLKHLIDALKVRIKNAEQRLESASTVIDQFGSIANLLEKVKQLQDENEKLKARKIRFNTDSLLKPRRLTKCEPSTLRAFLIALQNELAVVRASVQEANKFQENNRYALPDETELLAEVLLKSPLEFSDPLPPLEHKPLQDETISLTELDDPEAAGVSQESIEVQLIQVDNQFAALKEKTQRLRSELNLRKNAEKLQNDNGRSKVDKLHGLNERLLNEIQLLQEQLDSANQSSSILNEMLEQVNEEKQKMKQKSLNLSAEYNRLYQEHLTLRSTFDRTWKTGAGMFKLIEMFSKAYLVQVAPSEMFHPHMKFTPKESTGKPDFTENPPDFLIQFFKKAHVELLRRKAICVLQEKRSPKLEEVLSKFDEDMMLVELFDCVEKSPQQVLDMLNDKEGKQKVFLDMMAKIKEETQEHLDQCLKDLKDSITRLRDASDPILCKVKRAMSSQTFQARKNDQGTQFNKADLPRPGRKK